MYCYHKINGLFKRFRKGPNKGKFIIGSWSLPEFELLKDISWDWTEKLDGCLDYRNKILTDQGRIMVGKIVNQKLPVKVLSYNEKTNNVEFKEIVHYHKEKRIRNFMTIKVKNVRKNHRGSTPKYIVCTDNHKFYSNGEWVQAKHLKKGQTISHYFDNSSHVLTKTLNTVPSIINTEVIEINPTLPPSYKKKGKYQARYQYDISVKDNSNYFCNNILVHNTNMQYEIHTNPLISDKDKIVIRGRTEKSDISLEVMEKMEQLIKTDKVFKVFEIDENRPDAIIFGEMISHKINSGGKYFKEGKGYNFVVFDINVGGTWLTRTAVEEICKKLELPIVPVRGNGTISEAIEIVKQGMKSVYGDFIAEGLVLRPKFELKTRMGRRIITKVKYKDFCV